MSQHARILGFASPKTIAFGKAHSVAPQSRQRRFGVGWEYFLLNEVRIAL